MTAQGLRQLLLVGALLPALTHATPPDAPPDVTASGDTRRVDTTARAGSRDEAIAAALAQAVIQVQGKAVPFDVLDKMFLTSLRDERMVRMNVMNDSRIRATRISTAVAFVQDYQVSESRRDEDDGSWQARVSADVVLPEARLARHKETVHLALLPFDFMQEEEGEAGGMAAQAAMKKTLADIAGFRHQVEGLMKQQERIALHPLAADQDGPLGKAADAPGQVDWPGLARSTGASTFVTVQVEEFRTEAVKLKGNITTARLDGGYTFHYRLIRIDRGRPEIVQSGTFTIDTRSPFLHNLAMSSSNAQAAPAQIQARIAAVHARVAQLFASELLGELVMPQVMAREGDRLLLQPGASQLRTGDQVAVLGPDVTTPDSGTGLMLRQDGMRIAVLEVTGQARDRIEARVLKGNAFAVQPGSLLRRIGAGSTGVAAAAIPATTAPAAPAATAH